MSRRRPLAIALLASIAFALALALAACGSGGSGNGRGEKVTDVFSINSGNQLGELAKASSPSGDVAIAWAESGGRELKL